MTPSLQLPALFHGLYRDVKRRMSKVMTQLGRGADWVAVIEDGGFLDVATTPGHIVLGGPSPTLGGEEHFNTFVFWRLMSQRRDRLPPGTEERVFEQSLTTVWGTVGLMGDGAPGIVWPEPRHIPFLRAAVTCWDDLVAVGPRYTTGQQFPKPLWALPTTVGYVLANQGVPTPVLNAPLPPGGLLALVRQYGIDLTAEAEVVEATAGAPGGGRPPGEPE